MENNTNIYDDNNFLLKQGVCKNGVKELSGDYIIPDTVSDAESVLLCVSNAMITDTAVNNGYVSIKGTVIYDILLLLQDTSVTGVSYTEDFVLDIDDSEITEGSRVILSTPALNTSGKLANPRKISLSTVLTLPLCIYTPIQTSLMTEGADSQDILGTVQKRRTVFSSLSVVSPSEKGISVSYDMSLDGNNPPISKILFRRLRLTPYEIKARDNGIEVKTYADASVIYLSEEGNRFSSQKSFIIEKTVEFQDANTYEWTANVCPYDVYFEAAQNSYGENKVVEIDFYYDIELTGRKNRDVTAIADIYSTDYPCNCEKASTSYTSINRGYSSSLSVNASASREALNADEIRGVVYASVTSEAPTFEYSEEKKKLILDADANISMICENNNLDGSEVRYSSYTFTYPIKCELDCNDCGESISYIGSLGITDVRFRADSSKLYCDFECNVNAVSLSESSCTYAVKASIDSGNPIERQMAPITLCYPQKGETLWDIAKYYKVTPESIALSNVLDGECIDNKSVLLIPSHKKKVALF